MNLGLGSELGSLLVVYIVLGMDIYIQIYVQ